MIDENTPLFTLTVKEFKELLSTSQSALPKENKNNPDEYLYGIWEIAQFPCLLKIVYMEINTSYSYSNSG